MKMSVPWMRWVAVPVLLTALAGSGCENNSDVITPPDDGGGGTGFVIVPSAVQLRLGDSTATFSVQGGDAPMTWTVSDGSLGQVTDTSERFVNYTRAGITEGVNQITVADMVGRTARATVVQDDTSDAPGLSISRQSAKVHAVGDSVTLTARGGVPPYRWSVIDSSLGTLSNTSQSSVNYRRTAEAESQNVVELTDSLGNLATATMIHPALVTL